MFLYCPVPSLGSVVHYLTLRFLSRDREVTGSGGCARVLVDRKRSQGSGSKSLLQLRANALFTCRSLACSFAIPMATCFLAKSQGEECWRCGEVFRSRVSLAIPRALGSVPSAT